MDLYADQAMTQCQLADTEPGFKFVYVYLNGPVSATFVGFSARRPDCWRGSTWVADILPGSRLYLGNTQTVFHTSLYGNGDINLCKTPPVLVCTLLFNTAGSALPCCTISVTPIADPPFLPLYYHNCENFHDQPLLVGRSVTINGDQSCPCQLPVATEPTTWGRVKSLYR